MCQRAAPSEQRKSVRVNTATVQQKDRQIMLQLNTNVIQQHHAKQTTGNCNQIFRGQLFTIGQIFSEQRNTESQNLPNKDKSEQREPCHFLCGRNIKVRNQFTDANVTKRTQREPLRALASP